MKADQHFCVLVRVTVSGMNCARKKLANVPSRQTDKQQNPLNARFVRLRTVLCRQMTLQIASHKSTQFVPRSIHNTSALSAATSPQVLSAPARVPAQARSIVHPIIRSSVTPHRRTNTTAPAANAGGGTLSSTLEGERHARERRYQHAIISPGTGRDDVVEVSSASAAVSEKRIDGRLDPSSRKLGRRNAAD